MELKRLESAIVNRWVFVAGMALLGVAAALLFGGIASNQERLYEATASIRFDAPEGGTIADLAEELSVSRNLAAIAAGDLLQEDPTYQILEDLGNAKLDFVAQGGTQEEAIAKAVALRQEFLDVDPLAGGGSVDSLLRGIEEQASEVQAEIDSISAGPTPEQQQLLAAHATLDQSILAVSTRLADLIIEEAAAADAAARQDIAGQREFLEQRLRELGEEKAALDPLPTTELSIVDELHLAGLQAQMDALTAEYQRLSLRRVGVTDDGSALEQPVVQDLTPEPVHPWVQAAIGLIGGLLIAVLALIFLNRTRRPVWIGEDLPVALLGKVPARRITQSLSENWYQTAEPGPRKTAIQALRSAVEAHVPSSGATIAITGLEVSSDAVQALATDLASSMASAGSSVLLVDANFHSRSSIGRYQAREASLAQILGIDPKAPEFTALVAHTVETAPRVAPGLAILPSGPAPSSPADKLAGRQFRQLIAVGQEQYDVVIVVVDDAGTPEAQVAMQRLGYAMVAVTPGVPTVPEVTEVTGGIERLGIAMLGVVFLPKMTRLLPTRATGRQPGVGDGQELVTDSASTMSHSPISRLHNYPIPAERTSELVPHKSLKDLASAVDTGDGEVSDDSRSFGQQLVKALESADGATAAEAVSDYVLGETRDMVLAYHAYEAALPALASQMSDYGFLSLVPLKDFKTPAGYMEAEVAAEIGEAEAVELMRGMESALGGDGDSVKIDAWLDREFFARHLERSDGEPSIWHLVSPERAVSLLVPARRLSRAQLELIRYEVVSRTLDELERFRATMATRSNTEQADVFDAMIEDAREFERALTRLIGDGTENGRTRGLAWQPDWSKGTRINLAPVQAAGLLPFDVLGPEELSDLLSA